MKEFKCYQCDGKNSEGRKLCERCGGSGDILYADEEDYFNMLADRWREETSFNSFIDVAHPCYISIKKIGKKIVPYLLKRMQFEKTWLFCLLAEFANRTEIGEIKCPGNLGETTDRWIKWGIQKNLIEKKKVIIYSDGACSGNPGKGGYGTIVKFSDREKVYEGGYELTTNNRMELLGIIYPLERIGGYADILIYTDSQYVANAINKDWLNNWNNNGWKTAAKKPVKNQDLWIRLLNLSRRNNILIEWVKGHNDHPENERCDKIAVAARMRKGLYTDFEYEKERKKEA